MLKAENMKGQGPPSSLQGDNTNKQPQNICSDPQGCGAKTHPGLELQPVGIRWVCLNITWFFYSSCFSPDLSSPHVTPEPPILVQCDLNGIIHLSSPGWLDLWLPKHCEKYHYTICENTITLSAFSFHSLFVSRTGFTSSCKYPCVYASRLCWNPRFFFSLCDTTKTCSSLFTHQQTISILCLHRTSLDSQMPPRPICCSRPEQVAEDLFQSTSELSYSPSSVLGCQFQVTYFHPNNPTHVGRKTGFFLQIQLWNFPSLARPQNDLTWVKFMMCRQLIFCLVFSCTVLITPQSFILDWSLLSWSTDPSQATAKASMGGHTEE